MTGGALADALGRRFDPALEARILSLVPSLTETLFALGLEDRIVGRTTYCIHPADRVKKVASVGGTKKVNWRKVQAARPTHALLNIDENPKDMAAELQRRGILSVVTHPIEPADNGPLIRLIGGLFGRADAAARLADAFDAALAEFRETITPSPRRVLYLIWKDPWMTVSADTYISRFLALAGWRTVGGAGRERYPEIDLSEAVLSETDLVLFSSEPFAFGRNDLNEFRIAHTAHAAKGMLVDGEMLSWYGVRSIQGLTYLRDLAKGRSA
ncbi:MAG: helical backbone metal receptor [Rhodospirillaceae bacterium]